MYVRMLFFFAVTAALLTSPAHAELATLWNTCTGESDVEQKLKSCTAIINSKKETRARLAIAYNNRGKAWNEKGEFARAIADYTEAIRLDPSLADAYFNRGIAYYYKQELSGAIADYSDAIRLDPNHAAAYFYRAMAWRFKNDIDRAIADLTEAIRIAPDWPDAYTYRGDIWYQKREFDRAIADYTEAIRLDPKNADVYRDRGKVWFARGEFARAIADYTEAIRLAPDNGDHPADRGFAHFCLGDFPASAADLKTALELKLGGFKKLHVALFRFIARTRAGQDATPELASYYAGFKLPDPVFELYLGRGAPEAALERPRDRCEAEFYVGQWHLIRGSRDQARTHLQLAAVDGCGFVVPHHAAAVAELKRMTP